MKSLSGLPLHHHLPAYCSDLLLTMWRNISTIVHVIAGFRALQEKLDQPISAPSSPQMRPRSVRPGDSNADVASNLVQNIQTLKAEVSRLQSQLCTAQTEREYDFCTVSETERDCDFCTVSQTERECDFCTVSSLKSRDSFHLLIIFLRIISIFFNLDVLLSLITVFTVHSLYRHQLHGTICLHTFVVVPLCHSFYLNSSLTFSLPLSLLSNIIPYSPHTLFRFKSFFPFYFYFYLVCYVFISV